MRVTATIVAASFLLARETSATPTPDVGAQVYLFELTSCLVKENAARTRQLLDREAWGPNKVRKLRDMVEASSHCNAYDMRIDPTLFLGSLATAMYVHDHAGKPLPNYSAVAKHLPNSIIMTVPAGPRREAVAHGSFAECVFRARPEQVRDLIATKPASAAEQERWKSLDGVLAGCLPTEEGTSIAFSRAGLRSLLGTAAYRTDQTLRREAAPAATVH